MVIDTDILIDHFHGHAAATTLIEDELGNDTLRAWLVRPQKPPVEFKTVSQARRAELARLYAVGGPLSQVIIAERDAR